MSEEKLKPCVHCGSAAEVFDEADGKCQIHCSKCGMLTKYCASKKARQIWNARASAWIPIRSQKDVPPDLGTEKYWVTTRDRRVVKAYYIESYKAWSNGSEQVDVIAYQPVVHRPEPYQETTTG